jgi:DNA replication protein DnaC
MRKMDFQSVFANIENLPKVPCSRCGIVYRGKEKGFVCSTCLEKEKEKAIEAKLREKRAEELLECSNIPRRYKTAIFSPKSDIQNSVANYFVENFTKNPLDQSTDILLFGSVGTGKTYLSCAFAQELIRKRQIGVRYITEYQLLDLYFRKQYQEFASFREAKILIVDEIGKRELAEWQRVQLEELLSHRYNEMLPTIYITNLNQNQFKEFIGERLADRLRETNVKLFAFKGESLRGGGR